MRNQILKTCETCKHFTFFLDCGRSPKGIDRVSGGMKYESCSIERDYPSFVWWRCGKKGRFWEEGENYYSTWVKNTEELRDKIDKAAEELVKRVSKKEGRSLH